MRRAIVGAIGAALLLGVVLVATARASEDAERHVVDMRGFVFAPARLSVAVGDTVVWINRDVVPHTATAASFDSGEMATNEAWSWRATRAGTIEYVCAYHPSMRGTIEVRADD